MQLASCQSRCEWVNERSQTHEEENHKKQQVGNLGVVAFVISVFYLLLYYGGEPVEWESLLPTGSVVPGGGGWVRELTLTPSLLLIN